MHGRAGERVGVVAGVCICKCGCKYMHDDRSGQCQ